MDAHSPRYLLLQIVASLRHYLESLQEGGVTGLPVTPTQIDAVPCGESEPQARARAVEAAQKQPHQAARVPTFAQPPHAATPPIPSPAPKPVPAAPQQEVIAQAGDLFLSSSIRTVQTLEELRAEIGECQRCKLCRERTHIVFGVGNPRAELVFVGEAPGRDEDLKAEPFVGRAGQLLTEIITKGMKMRREDVYIANVVKCRPPENRNPEPDEIAACEPFLIKQLELIRPRIIVALGTFAAQTLLKSKTPISRLRGIWHSYQGIKVMPTLHPAYLLRNPHDKRLVWQDIQAVLRELGRL
jgi:DNA polymerase